MEHWSATTAAMCIADKLGQPDLAEQHAQRFLSRGGHELSIARAHALIGRQHAKRGDRATAVESWRKAAAVAMDGRWHLYALCVGWQCGGKEGRPLADAACEVMGRPMDVILNELEAAGAEFEGGQTASAWAYSWATEVAKSKGDA